MTFIANNPSSFAGQAVGTGPVYDVDAYCKGNGPCIYWHNYAGLFRCLQYENEVQAQTEQLQQIEHPAPFHLLRVGIFHKVILCDVCV